MLTADKLVLVLTIGMWVAIVVRALRSGAAEPITRHRVRQRPVFVEKNSNRFATARVPSRSPAPARGRKGE